MQDCNLASALGIKALYPPACHWQHVLGLWGGQGNLQAEHLVLLCPAHS